MPVRIHFAPFPEQPAGGSTDGDFRRLVEAVPRKGIRVAVISSMDVASDGLRSQADGHIDLEERHPAISKESSRPARKRRTDPDLAPCRGGDGGGDRAVQNSHHRLEP